MSILELRIQVEEPLKINAGLDRKLQIQIPGRTIRGALISAFMQYRCSHSKQLCSELKCDQFNNCEYKSIRDDIRVSFANITCPSCSNALIKAPENLLHCKKCLREGKGDFIKTAKFNSLTSCDSCEKTTIMVKIDGMVCTSCNVLHKEIIRVKDVTGITVKANTKSVDEDSLFSFPVLIPGYEFIFSVSAEDKTARFIESLVDKSIFIGGSRSRGYGRCIVLSVKKIESKNLISTDEIILTSPAIISKNKIGNFKRKDIKDSNGNLSEYNYWVDDGKGNGNKSTTKIIANSGAVIKLKKNIEISVDDKMFPEGELGESGFGAFIPSPDLNKIKKIGGKK